MAKIEYIDAYRAIGDSLTAINNNFIALDADLKYLESQLNIHTSKLANFMFSSLEVVAKDSTNIPNIYLDNNDITLVYNTPAQTYNYISNMNNTYNIIQNNISKLTRISDNIQEAKSSWEYATTLVQENSALWLRPVSLMYPCIFEEPAFRATPAIRDEVSTWLNKHFPVININGDVNYIENQIAHIFITYKLENIHPNATDTTIHNNIQTIVFAVRNCTWQVIDYLIGDQVAPPPSAAPTVTPTRTPTSTPVPTPTVTSTPANTPTPTITPTPTFVDYFSLQLAGINADTGKNNGEVVFILRCFHKGFYTIKIGTRAYSAEDSLPIVCGDLPAGRYVVTITNYNVVIGQTPKAIIAELVIPYFAGGSRFIYKGRSLNIGDVILAEDRPPLPT